MSVEFKLGATALSVEASAVALMLLGSSDEALLYQYFALHALASGLMTPVLWSLLPRHYRQPALAVMALIFVLCFFIPVLGLLGFLLAALASRSLPYFRRRKEFSVVASPVYQPSRQAEAKHFRAGRMREQLMDRGSSVEMRMRALLALQHIPSRQSGALLREALSDSADDLRLLAYGMLEGREQELTLQIQHALQQYRRFSPQDAPAEHFRAARELAELYWEMIYQQLVQGDMRDFAQAQVAKYAREALHYQVRDAGLWVISGRLRLLQGDGDGAAAAFSSAIALGFPAVRAEPYLAELAFLRRDYPAVRRLMRRIRREGRMPQLSQAGNFWG